MDENGIVTGIGNIFDLANDTVESELCNTTGTALGSTFRMLQLVAVFEDAEAISYGKKKKYFCCGHSRIVYAAKFVCRPYGRRAYSIGGKSRFKFGRHIFRSRQFGRSYDGRG